MQHIRQRHALTITAVAFVLLLSSASAYAHAILLESAPSDGAVLKTAPTEIVLRFNAKIEKKVSRLTLLDAKGAKLALPERTREEDAQPDRIVVKMPRLGPGTYRLQYLVLAADGHATPGLVRFTVSGEAPR